MNTTEKIRKILTELFYPTHLDIFDDSAKHAGHAESKKSGGGHYEVLIVSERFDNKKLIERHRMINEALKKEFSTTIHALKIIALTPQEFQIKS